MKKELSICLLLAIAAGLPVQVKAQWSQETACPGWNNPTNFTTGSTSNYYSGTTGSKQSQAPNAVNGTTGVNWSSTILTASQMADYQMNVGGDLATFPNGYQTDRAYAIYDTTKFATGHPTNRDPNTGDQLPLVPTQFNTYDTSGLTVNTNLTRSIRLGSGRGRQSGADNSVAVYYNMQVTPSNALLYLYYAGVFEAAGHTVEDNPSFMIRVMKQNTSGQWEQVSDTLAYFIVPDQWRAGTNGWHQAGSGYNSILYCDWRRAVLNLQNLLYTNVRIEVMVTGCSMVQHWAYGYLCGECRPMTIASDGNPTATLMAPRGMQNYVWYASEYGMSDFPLSDLMPGHDDDYFTFRQLTADTGTEADSAWMYTVQQPDFAVTYRPNAAHVPGIAASADSVAYVQTFRCTMTSALDPAKPYQTHLYVNAPKPAYSLTVTSEDEAKGTVASLYAGGDQYSISASPECGYHFTHWNDGNTENPRFVTVTQDTAFTAYFDLLHDTIYLHDTVYIQHDTTIIVIQYDTIQVHDTVYIGGEGVDAVLTVDCRIYQQDGCIVVEGAEAMPARVYDAAGRELAGMQLPGGGRRAWPVPASGVYMVRIGDMPARRVVAIK